MSQEPPALVLLPMMRGYWVSQAIGAAAQLGIAEGRKLRVDTLGGLPAEMCPARSDPAACSRQSCSTRPGASCCTAYERAGRGFFAHLAAHPESGQRFQEMRAHLNLVTNAAVPAAYDFSGCSTIVDVGGGNGSLLASVLATNASTHGILFDLPHVLDQARRQIAVAGVAARCELVGEDFFAGVPTGGDTYLLRWILHDFDDERAARILRACRAAMPPDGRLLVIEQVVGGRGEPGDWIRSARNSTRRGASSRNSK